MVASAKHLEEQLSEKHCKKDCLRLLSNLEAIAGQHGIRVEKTPEVWSEKTSVTLSRGPRALKFKILDHVEKGDLSWGLVINEKDSGGPGIVLKREGDGWHRFKHVKRGEFWEKLDNFFDFVETEVLKFFGAVRRSIT